jgi:hypothetical protein
MKLNAAAEMLPLSMTKWKYSSFRTLKQKVIWKC